MDTQMQSLTLVLRLLGPGKLVRRVKLETQAGLASGRPQLLPPWLWGPVRASICRSCARMGWDSSLQKA